MPALIASAWMPTSRRHRDGRAPLALNKTLADAIDRYEREILPGLKSKQSVKYFLAYWREELGRMRFAELAAFLPDAVERLAKENGSGSIGCGSARSMVGGIEAFDQAR